MARIPGEAIEITHSKLDTVGRHITAAVQMIAMECNPFSTHVVVKAAHEMIEVMARERGVLLDGDPQIWIKDEYQKEYRTLANKAYNYLKHANRGSDEPYEGPPPQELAVLNDILTLLNINGYKALGGYVDQAAVEFSMVLLLKYPKYFKTEFVDSLPGLKEHRQSVSADPEILAMALRERLRRTKVLPSD